MISEHQKDLDPAAPVPVKQAQPDSETHSAFKLQPDPAATNSCSLEDLLRYHDRSFVLHAYEVIARRNPTSSELTLTLDDLRTGEKGKIEIIEGLVASQKETDAPVIVDGLPSPTLRKLIRWPVIGPVFRVLRAITRLPVMMRDQQRFESYVISQQQRLADFVNEEIVPSVNLQKPNGPGDLKTTVYADLVDSVLMLSDSVVELAAKQAGLEENNLVSQERLTLITTQLVSVESAQRQLQSQAEQLARALQHLQAQITSMLDQREKSEALFHQDLLGLTKALESSQEQLAGLQTRLDPLDKQLQELSDQSAENAASQREFLIQEQRLIVETQKVAINELQTQITETQQAIQETRALIDRFKGAGTPGKESEKL